MNARMGVVPFRVSMPRRHRAPSHAVSPAACRAARPAGLPAHRTRLAIAAVASSIGGACPDGARTEPGKTRQRTVYTLTDKGLEALAAWARTAVRLHPGQERTAAPPADRRPGGLEAVTRESITTIRDDISDLFVRLEDIEAVRPDASLPDQVPAAGVGRRRLRDLHLECVDDLERELAAARPLGRSPRRARAQHSPEAESHPRGILVVRLWYEWWHSGLRRFLWFRAGTRR